MLDGLTHWLESYGYAGLAIGVLLESAGIPVPGETALLVAAFAAGRGTLSLPYVIGVAAAAGVVGDNLGYGLGRKLGRGWVERHGHRFFFPAARLRQMERFFDRFGAAAVAVARFVTGVRVVAAFSAGVARMRWPVFIAFNVLGALAWASLIGALGYAAGLGYSAFGLRPWMIGAFIVGVIGLVIAVTYLERRIREPLTAWVARSWLGRLFGWEIWILALSLSGLLLFAKIAEDVVEQEAGPFDAAIRNWMLAHHSPAAAAAFTGVGWLGSPEVLVPLALGAALWFRFRRRTTTPVVVLVASLLGSAVFLGLKAAFQRAYPTAAPLPPTAQPFAPAPAYSFPSGHATLITAVTITIAYILVRQHLAHWTLVTSATLALILAVGTSRVYLDVSRATDVLGGWAAGLFVAAIAATLYEKNRTPQPAGRDPTAPGRRR